MPHRLRSQVDALAAMTEPGSWNNDSPGVDAAILVMLAQACRDGERLEFTYSDRGGEVTDPYRLVSLGRRWYLVAWDLTRHDWRTFRLDRIAAAHDTRALPTTGTSD
jgi:predicted DNA-binding transcriptional regulator YafY